MTTPMRLGPRAIPPLFSIVISGGLWSTYTVPILIGVLQRDFHLGAGPASVIGSLQLAAAAITSIALGRFRRIATIPSLPTVATALVAGGYLAAFDAHGVIAMAALMILVGIGQGIYTARGTMLIANQADSEHLFGRVFAVAAVVLACTNFFLPLGVHHFGGPIYFVVSACGGLVVFGAARALAGGGFVARETAYASGHGASHPTATIRSVGSRTAAALLMVIGISEFMPIGGIYAIADPVASVHNLSLLAVGAGLSAANAGGFLGGELSRRVGLRLGAFIPHTVVSICLVLLILGLGVSTSPAAFIALMGSLGVLYVFINSQIMSLAAVIDRTGGLAAELSGANALSSSVGTAAYGLLFGRYGAPGILIAGTLSLIVVVAIAAILRRRQVAPAGALLSDSAFRS